MNATEKLVASGGLAALYVLSIPGDQPFFTPLGLAVTTTVAVGPLAIVVARLVSGRLRFLGAQAWTRTNRQS
jgi:hypothetical protein